MATIPRIQRKPEPPKPPPVPTYTMEQMTAFGWIGQHVRLSDGRVVVPRMPDPRIPSGVDPRIPRKDPTQ